MNHPMLWHSLRVIAALHLLCIGAAALEFTIGGFLARDSASLGALLQALLFTSALWIFFTTSLQLIVLPIVLLFHRRTPELENEQQEDAIWEAERARWTNTLSKFTRLLLGPEQARHWGFLVAFGVAALFGFLSVPFALAFAQNTLSLSPTVGFAISATGAWGLGYLLYRGITWRKPASATYPWILALSAIGVIWWVTFAILKQFDNSYIRLGLWATFPPLMLLALMLTKKLSLRATSITLVTSFVMFAASYLGYGGNTAAHKLVMHRATFGHALVTHGLVFFDPDADDLPSHLPAVDCGEWDEFQNFEAIEVLGDGKDNNCMGGDQSEDDIAPMRPVDAPLARLAMPARKPPVIFITVDTLRADYIGKQIGGKNLTPNLSALFASASHFSHAYAPSTHTMDSLPSTLSGMYPGSALMNGVFLGNDRPVPEMLQQLGYRTEAITTIPSIHHSLTVGLDALDNELGTLHRDDSAISADEVTRKGVASLDRLAKSDKPFFLWLHYFDPHGFYIYKDGLTPWLDQVEDPILKGYAQEVWRTDNQIGAFLRALEKQGIAKEAIIVVFSDHGEALGEDGLTDHGWHATESILRVPFAIKLPGESPREVKEPVSLLDLAPTMIDALQIQNTEPRPGRSLLGAMRGDKLEPRPIFISATYRHRPVLWSVIEYPWKLTFDRMRWTFRLQNVEEDPNALTDTSANHRERFDYLKKRMGEWRDRHFHDRFIEQKANRLKQRRATVPAELKGEVYAPQLEQ
jgi:arylsulfatase A-like enzyme